MSVHNINRYDVERLERMLAGPSRPFLWQRGARGPRFSPRHENQWAKHSRRIVKQMAGQKAKPSYRQRQASAKAAKRKAQILM